MSQLIVRPVWTKSLPHGTTVAGTMFVVASFVGAVFSNVSTESFPVPLDLMVKRVPITLTWARLKSVERSSVISVSPKLSLNITSSPALGTEPLDQRAASLKRPVPVSASGVHVFALGSTAKVLSSVVQRLSSLPSSSWNTTVPQLYFICEVEYPYATCSLESVRKSVPFQMETPGSSPAFKVSVPAFV